MCNAHVDGTPFLDTVTQVHTDGTAVEIFFADSWVDDASDQDFEELTELYWARFKDDMAKANIDWQRLERGVTQWNCTGVYDWVLGLDIEAAKPSGIQLVEDDELRTEDVVQVWDAWAEMMDK
ncbi:hypothetical protein KC318_g1550 [Hortaea werneckii]|nr:hypothetical protein KC334_g1604 [Hortaea werneckii]KAI7024103.1 hypothetical protein KC355_g1512 [Hortaea werneckii]KAI7674507.1 hypothetical protein KC318_g1550 [Hortaea werneckii]